MPVLGARHAIEHDAQETRARARQHLTNLQQLLSPRAPRLHDEQHGIAGARQQRGLHDIQRRRTIEDLNVGVFLELIDELESRCGTRKRIGAERPTSVNGPLRNSRKFSTPLSIVCS